MVMGRVVLISCVSKKLPHKAKAKQLYTSTLFKFNLAYARSLNPEAIFILSAKYGLLDLEQEIEPYDLTLNTMAESEKKAWADRVAGQLRERIDFSNDEVIFLAGQNYRKHLFNLITHASAPMQGLGIGKQLHYLKEKLAHE